MLKKSTIIIFLMLLVFPFVFCVNAQELQPIELTWTTGGVGGTWYSQGAGIAELIHEKEPKITIKIVPGGGMLNPGRVGSGEVPIGFGLSISDVLAFSGKEPFLQKYPDLREMGGPTCVSNVHFVVAKELGLTTVEQVMEMIKEGKPLNMATTTPGASDYLIFKEVLAFYGLSFEDVKKAGGKVFNAAYLDMANLYKDKHVDFTFTNGTPPMAHIIESNVSRPISLLAFSKEVIEHLNKTLGLLPPDSIHSVMKGGYYPGVDQEIIYSPSTANTLIVNKNVPEEVVYTIVKIICENTDRLIQIDPGLAVFTPETAWQTDIVPLHPGAEKYYREMGYIK